MNAQNSSISFQNLPSIYEKWKNHILNSNLNPINKIYSQLNFRYLKCQPIHDKTIEEQTKSLLLDFLKNIKFFTYDIEILPINENKDNINVVICSEEKCHIIESIDSTLFTKILQNINSSKIDVNKNSEVKDEIKSFFENYGRKTIINNFVKKTINPIIAYFIRRYYYPSNFFKNKNFFNFNQKQPDLFEQNMKEKVSTFISKNKNNLEQSFPLFSEQILKEIDEKNEIKKTDENQTKKIEFDEYDFIKIRNIGKTQESSIILVMHIETLYVCVLKVSNFSDREIEFSKKYSHRCLLKFYGFVRNKFYNSLIGGIYEFMSNGELSDFVTTDKADYFFSFLTINRLSQGIDYLHSNSYVHRDLKPGNILIDHDFIPYISDFNTIKTIDLSSEAKTTQNIGIIQYASPEQMMQSNEKLNFSTDIYSFGQLLYLLFEKKDMIEELDIDYILKRIKNIPKMKNASEKIQKLCQKCVSNEPKERPKISHIKLFIYEQIKSLNLNGKNNDEFEIMVQFFYENIIFLHQINSDDLYEFGSYYYNQKDDEQNFIKAREYYEMSAEKNNVESIFQLGNIYFYGNGVKKDIFKAKDYYQLGSDLGFWKCDFRLAEVYLNDEYSLNDINKTIEYFKKSAPFNPHGYHFLGVIYYQGHKVKSDFKLAKYYFELAAEKNVYPSISYLGMMYLEGDGVEKDYSKALKYFEISAKENDMLGRCQLGYMYYNGLVVDQDEDKALKYFTLSSKQGYHLAYFYLGEIYSTSCNGRKEYRRALDCYLKAAEKGLVEAYSNVAYMYYEGGDGIEKDIEKSLYYFEIAAEHGNSIAQFNIGDIYYNGDGVKKDFRKAKKYFELSAGNQNFDAIFNLGVIYCEGKGVEQNYRKSFEFFKNSGDQNHLPSLYYLGLFYQNGIGIDIDISKSIDSYKKCANSNSYQLEIRNRSEKTVSEAIEKNDYYLPSKNNLGLIYLLELNNKEEAEKYLGDAGRSSYSYGQNNLGLFYQYFLNNKNEAIHFLSRASTEGNFSFAEFNIGFIEENDNIESAIEHYMKSLVHIDLPLKYKDSIIFDDRFDISKSFVSCYMNLKLADFYFSQSKIEEGEEHLLNAIFQSLFKFLFQNNKDSNRFKFIASNQQNEKKLNLKDFFLNFQLFNLSNQQNFQLSNEICSQTKWESFQPDPNEKVVIIQHQTNNFHESTQEKNPFDLFNQIPNDRQNRIQNTNNSNIEQISDDFVKNIFKKMNYDDQFEFIEFDISNENNNMNIFKFKLIGDEIEKNLKYPKDFKEFLLNNLNVLKIEINDLIMKMKEILNKQPYPILFGRINLNKIISRTNNDNCANINNDFIEGFES